MLPRGSPLSFPSAPAFPLLLRILRASQKYFQITLKASRKKKRKGEKNNLRELTTLKRPFSPYASHLDSPHLSGSTPPSEGDLTAFSGSNSPSGL